MPMRLRVPCPRPSSSVWTPPVASMSRRLWQSLKPRQMSGSSKIGFGPSLVPVKRQEAERAFELYVSAGVRIAMLPQGSARFAEDLIELLVLNNSVERDNFTLLETKEIAELCKEETMDEMNPGEADRLMIEIPNLHIDDDLIDLAIKRAEALNYPKGYGIASKIFAMKTSTKERPRDLLERLKIISEQNKLGANSGFKAIQCPMNIFETNIIDTIQGEPSILLQAQELGIEVYADHILHSSPIYPGDPVSFLSEPPGLKASINAAESDLGPITNFKSEEERWIALAKSIEAAFNTAIGMEKQYEAMRTDSSEHASLPMPNELAWGQIILANRDNLENSLKWEFARRTTIVPKVDAAVRRLTENKEFKKWGTAYMSILMKLINLFGASVHERAARNREQLVYFLKNRLRDCFLESDLELDNLKLEEICVILLRCSGVDAVLTDAPGVLQVANSKSSLDAKEALRIMTEAKEFYEQLTNLSEPR